MYKLTVAKRGCGGRHERGDHLRRPSTGNVVRDSARLRHHHRHLGHRAAPGGRIAHRDVRARIDDTCGVAAGSGANTAAVATADQPDVDSEPGSRPTGEDDEAGDRDGRADDYLPASLGDRVWLDADHDGVQGASEVGVAGVTVRDCSTTTAPSRQPQPVPTVTTCSLG
jgi:hypothetical protein